MATAFDPHVHSTYSTYDGMGSVKAVVARAVELGWGAVCLTEHGWMGSAPALYSEAMKAGIKPIIGCEFYVAPDHLLIDGNKEVLAETRHLTVLALTTEGYHNLVAWTSASFERPLYYNKPRISLERMIRLAPWPLHHNVVLSGCMGSELCQSLLHLNGQRMFAGQAYLEACKAIFPNFYVEIQHHRHKKFYDQGLANYDRMCDQQAELQADLLKLAKHCGVPILVSNDSHYQAPSQRKAHLAMMAPKLYRRTRESHEGQVTGHDSASFAHEYVYWTNYMRSIEKIAESLPKWARDEAIQNALDIQEEANVVLDPLDKFSYSIPFSGYKDPIKEIEQRSKPRLKRLIAKHGEMALERFEFELEAMAGFGDYLLMMADIIKQAREQGIYTWTRGSAANSIVCFCLGIHEIDSIHYKLLFERFVNPVRNKMPDIDIDVEDERRADVVKIATQMMESYEGVGNVRPICTYGTVANRSAFRLMAESSGMSKEQIEEVANLLPQMIDSGMVTDEVEAYEMLKEEYPDLYELASEVFDAIASVSQHAAGIVFGTKDRKLTDWVPNYRIGSSNAVVTQYNMKWIEEMGFVKGDFLVLSSLSVMHKVARMVGKDMKWLDEILRDAPGQYGEPDEATFEILRAGHTEGVHSFQGGSQRRGCMEVGIESDFDAVAIQALYRPSGTRTGFDKTFCNRRHGREEWNVEHPILAANLNETYGLPIYQEQIMQIGFDMGMTGEEIDDLYKAIKTAKGIGRGAAELFEAFKPTFMKYAKTCKPPMPKDDAEDAWLLFDAFQGYGFNRGHATSYGILALKTAYLLAHHPREFFIALLEKFPDNPRYVSAAIAAGYKFEPPDVNAGAGGFTRGSDDKTIRVGLARIHGLGPGAVGELVRNQPFGSLDDMRERCDTSTKVKAPVIEALAKVGALESLGIKRSSDDDPDITEFELLNFVLRKPAAFKGCKPSFPQRSGRSTWKYTGLERGVTITEGKTFCSKLFWVPPLEEDAIFHRKASAMGKGNAFLLTAVDENGLPFDLVVYDSERKAAERDLIRLLAKKCRGSVLCAEGQISMPFLRGRPTSFKLWGITGAEQQAPQIWHTTEKIAEAITYLAIEKTRTRQRSDHGDRS